MIFVLAANEPKLFMMLAEKDLATMRSGLTVFVDEHQLKGAMFNGVIVSLHKTNEEAVEMIKLAGHNVSPDQFVTPKPTVEEACCDECGGIMPVWNLLNQRCIVCWRNIAIRWMGREAAKGR